MSDIARNASRPPQRRPSDLVAGITRSREAVIFAAIAVLGTIFAATNDVFLTQINIANIAVQSSTIMLVAFGMTIVIIGGGIDLSVGATASIVGVIAVWLLSNLAVPVYAAMLMALCVGVVIGAVNGVMTAWLNIPSIIATLATMTTLRGLSYLASGGFTIRANDPSFGDLASGGFGPLPYPALIAAGACVFCYVLLRHTVLGRYVYAVGGSPHAALLAGLPVRRVILASYILSGSLAGLAGLVAASRTEAGSPIIGTGWELQAVAIVILGGTSLFGGSGGVIGSLLGAILLAIINNWISLQGIEWWMQGTITGTILLLVVGLGAATASRRPVARRLPSSSSAAAAGGGGAKR